MQSSSLHSGYCDAPAPPSHRHCPLLAWAGRGDTTRVVTRRAQITTLREAQAPIKERKAIPATGMMLAEQRFLESELSICISVCTFPQFSEALTATRGSATESVIAHLYGAGSWRLGRNPNNISARRKVVCCHRRAARGSRLPGYVGLISSVQAHPGGCSRRRNGQTAHCDRHVLARRSVERQGCALTYASEIDGHRSICRQRTCHVG